MPLLPEASVLASRLLTLKVALPLRSSVLLSAIPSALTVRMSALPLALIVVLAKPVVMLMPLSAALPVLTTRLPLSPAALMLPTRLFATCWAAPLWVSVMFWPRTPASMVRVSPLALPLTVVAPLPLVMRASSSLMSP